jgi:DNA-binding NarL/FixJ family response regulator
VRCLGYGRRTTSQTGLSRRDRPAVKQIAPRHLVAALEAVGRGESLLEPDATGRVLERSGGSPAGDASHELTVLTPQDPKILMLVG